MLSWLRKRFEFKSGPRNVTTATVGVRVVAGANEIELFNPGQEPATIAWDDLQSVIILTTTGGPLEADLFWLLVSRDRQKQTLRIPMGAEGEHDLLVAMQSRLAGFDNMAVVEAMGSTADASFTIWDIGQMASM